MTPPDRKPLTTRQEEIIRVATELFARDGYRAVGMRAIADAVGVRTSSLYHHFPSKENLLHAISLDVTRDFITEHLALLSGPAPAPEKLAALLRKHIVYMSRHRVQQVVGKRELRELSAEHLQEVQESEREYRRRIQDFLAVGVRSGEFAVDDPKIAALAILDLVNGVNTWFHDGRTHSIDAVAELYASLALSMLGARATARSPVRAVS